MRSLTTALFALGALIGSIAVQAADALKVGTNANGAPWSFHDAKSNTEHGISVELISAIAKDAGFQIELMPMALGELIPELNSNKIDIIAANLLISAERKALVDFSDPIAPGGDGLVILKTDTMPYKTLEDLKGLAVGTQAGSPFAAIIQKSGLFPDLKIYPDGFAAMRAVGAGEVKLAVVGGNLAAYEIKLGHYPDVRLAKSWKPLFSSDDAFSVRKTDGELLKKINVSLAKLKDNGTLKMLLSKYGFD